MNQTNHMQLSIWLEWKKGEVILGNTAPKGTSDYLLWTTIGPFSMNSGTRLLRQEKIVSRRILSLTSWIADKYFKQAKSFARNKSKNESRLLKFYEVKQLKENSRILLKR